MGLVAGFPAAHWYRTSALSLALWPLSLVFRTFVAARRALYASTVLPATRLTVPVVVVGNLVAGGGGKTPLVLWLAQALGQRAYRPGIVSRGYGGSATAPASVPRGGDCRIYGDEPVLLAERAGCPVWIGRDRVAAARALLVAHPACNLIVCDDGLQHYALARDVEIAVQDGRGLGNGFMLPAGPLREPATRRVDATVSNGGAGAWRMTLEPAGFWSVSDPSRALPMAALAGKRLHAVAGIGHPQRFFETLTALGLAFTPHAFPDHHPFRPADVAFADCDVVLMTEKDAVKCRAFDRDDLAALRVDARLDHEFADFITGKLHGFQTA